MPDVETAARVAPDGTRLLFLLNHGAGPVEVPAPAGGVDLLSGARVECGGRLSLDTYGVVVVREDGGGALGGTAPLSASASPDAG